MDQETPPNSQESIQFGIVNLVSQLHASNDSSNNSQSVLDEVASTNQIRQNPVQANFGPCIICNISKRCILFIECNHLACCSQCSTTINNICPVLNCNQPIREYLPVFEP
ncbi:hypothetical protein I4U23_027622 [Adineta vaga]|nr:hypothetical protein I4U23_027622 [Adineta vaga]